METERQYIISERDLKEIATYLTYDFVGKFTNPFEPNPQVEHVINILKEHELDLEKVRGELRGVNYEGYTGYPNKMFNPRNVIDLLTKKPKVITYE